MTGPITVVFDVPNLDNDSSSVIETKAAQLFTDLNTWNDQANSLASSLNFNATNSTSSTSWTIADTGTQTFSIESGKSYVVGMTVKVAATSNATKWGLGDVTAVSSGLIDVSFRDMSTTGGTFSDWTISQNASTFDLLSEIKFRASANGLYAGSATWFLDIVSGTHTQTIDSAATLGAGWWILVRNSGTGVITLDPTGAQTINGASTLKIYNGETYRVMCDGSALYAVLVSREIGDQEIIAHTGNGYGSTNTKRRRYTTKVKDTANGMITYADSATLGATFTINAPGDYLITRQEKYNTVAGTGGIVLNPSSGTTNYQSLAYAEKLGGFCLSNALPYGVVTVMRRLAVGDVIGAQDAIVALDGNNDEVFFSIKRMN